MRILHQITQEFWASEARIDLGDVGSTEAVIFTCSVWVSLPPQAPCFVDQSKLGTKTPVFFFGVYTLDSLKSHPMITTNFQAIKF